jgi:hypothetical protein
MPVKRFPLLVFLSLAVSVTGCCNWCQRHCCQPAQSGYPTTYAPPPMVAPQAACCQPAAPVCCQPAPTCCNPAPVCCNYGGYAPVPPQPVAATPR